MCPVLAVCTAVCAMQSQCVRTVDSACYERLGYILEQSLAMLPSSPELC